MSAATGAPREEPAGGHVPPYWYVTDYDDRPLPGEWPTETEATERGLCSKYLLSGYEVLPGPKPAASPER